MSQQSHHYAFVASGAPLEIPVDVAAPGTSNTGHAASGGSYDLDLVALYQSYAERFPNPRLIEEYQERDQLLQATSAATAHRSSLLASQSSNKKRKSWFGFLWSGSGGDKDDNDNNQSKRVKLRANLQSNSSNEEEEWLVYTEVEDGPTDQKDYYLCGTNHSLDRSCISQEAHSMARLSLVSTRTRKERHQTVRTSPHVPSDTIFCIVGLGVIAEWTAEANNNNPSQQQAQQHQQEIFSNNWSITSDRSDLLRFADRRGFDLSMVRAVNLGPNFLMVSWGFSDGIVVFYRRVTVENSSIAWEPAVYLGPSQAVLEHSFDVFADDDENDEDAGSALLRVTDMVPMVVNTPGGPAAGLTVSRLGGYMEVLGLPTNLWFGPILPPNAHKPRPKVKQGKNGPHYAKHFLVNIAADNVPIDILALTTLDYHLDILCLEAFRTRVPVNPQINQNLYGNAPPPAHYVLIASGTHESREILTFWAISYQFAAEQPRDGSAGFALHAVLQEALDVGSLGSDMSIFANRAILNHWRHPRKVSLKERSPPPPAEGDDNIDEALENSENRATIEEDSTPALSVYERVTTITASAPIVSMHAVVAPTDGASIPSSVMLSMLDWNGSVTVMDCSLLERVVSHSLSDAEYQQIHEADIVPEQGEDTAPAPQVVLVKTLIDRSLLMQTINGNVALANGLVLRRCVSVQWMARAENLADPWLVLLTSGVKQKDTQVVILSGVVALSEENPMPASQSIPFPSPRASLQGTPLIMRNSPPGIAPLLRILFPPKGDSHNVCMCLLQPLRPNDIIISLARDGKHEKAIHAAELLSQEEQHHVAKIVEECRQKLWEQSFDLKWLKQLSDDGYIVRQALSLLEGNHIEGDKSENNLDSALVERTGFDQCREIFTFALQRASNIRLAAALTIGHDGEEAKEKLQKSMVFLGTYQLICNHLNVEVSFLAFREIFAQASILDLAKSFALESDIAALSIILFRHMKELHPHKLDILRQLPMSLSPRHYCFLLPVIPRGLDSDNTHYFISDIPPCERNSLLHIAQLPSFLLELGVRVVLDISDEKMVLELNAGIDSTTQTSSESLIDFYIDKANEMQRLVGNLQHVADFCALGVLALETNMKAADIFSDDALIEGMYPATQQLVSTGGCAMALNRMLEEAIEDSNMTGAGVELSSFSTVTPSELSKMNLVDVVTMVLGGVDDVQTLCEIQRQHLLPLIRYLPQYSEHDLDGAIRDYCVALVRKSNVNGLEGARSRSSFIDEAVDDDDNLLAAVKTCSAVASGSSSAIAKASRIIKNQTEVVSLVLASILEVSRKCESTSISPSLCRTLVEMMWKMYESIPAKVSNDLDPPDRLVNMMREADLVYEDLVGIDIISQWPECQQIAFSFAMKRTQEREHILRHQKSTSISQEEQRDEAETKLSREAQEVLSGLCHSFCVQAKSHKGSGDLPNLMRGLLSDLLQLFRICYHENKELLPVLSSTLSSELISPLSRYGEFNLVALLLSSVDKSWWDYEQESRFVRSYVDSIVFSDENDETRLSRHDGDNSLQAAIACQDALGPVFPDLQDGFQRSRQYLDAAHFINTVIFVELKMPKQIKPNDLRGDPPLDVVESILRALPTAISIGCKEWADEAMAIHANKALRNFQERSSDSADQLDEKQLPPLPGGAVFHLAGILGLEDSSSVMVVKSRVVHHGVSAGMFGASAAVCRSMLHDHGAFSSDADSVARLSAVADVVAQEKYEDEKTKLELCLAALGKFQTNSSIYTCRPLDLILKTFSFLEAKHATQMERLETLKISSPPDSIGMLHEDTWSQYSLDIHELFATLRQQASDGLVDDTLLNAISRYAFFSCIFRGTRPRMEHAGKFEHGQSKEILVLATALLLHIQNGSTLSTSATKELKQIIEKQTIAVINQHPAAFQDPFAPKHNPEIVRQLIGRGFTPMAARWSALMTKNVGPQQALQWGVANARDPRMNDPIVIVPSPQRLFLEKSLIQQVMDSLSFTQKFLSETREMQKWINDRSAATLASVPCSDVAPTVERSGVPAASKREVGTQPVLPQHVKVTQPPQARPAERSSHIPISEKQALAPPPPRGPPSTSVAPSSTPQVSPPSTSIAPSSTQQAIPPSEPPTKSLVAGPQKVVATKPLPPTPSRVAHSFKVSPATAPVTARGPVKVSAAPIEPQGQKKQTVVIPVVHAHDDFSSKPPVIAGTAKAGSSLTSRNGGAKAQKLVVNIGKSQGIKGNSFLTPTNRPPSMHLGQSTGGSSTTSERSALKERGQAALEIKRSTPRNQEHSIEDRRRLIEAGRRLLAKSRAKNATSPRLLHATNGTAVSPNVSVTTDLKPAPRGSSDQSAFFAEKTQTSRANVYQSPAATKPLGTSVKLGSGLVAPPPPPVPPPAAITSVANEMNSESGWDFHVDDLGDWDAGSAGGRSASRLPLATNAPTPAPAASKPEASESEAGWDFETDDLGEMDSSLPKQDIDDPAPAAAAAAKNSTVTKLQNNDDDGWDFDDF